MTNELIEISRPLSYDSATGTYSASERSLAGLRVAHGKQVRQGARGNRTDYSRTRVSGKPPSPAMLALIAAAELFGGDVPTGKGISVTTMRSAEKRGLGTCLYQGERRHEVTGFRVRVTA